MKCSRIVAFIVMLTLLLVAATAGARDNIEARAGRKAVSLSGRVSNDGTVLVADDDNPWTVTNVEALKGFERQYVTVRCRMEPERRAIRVFSVLGPGENHPHNLGDSAFRR